MNTLYSLAHGNNLKFAQALQDRGEDFDVNHRFLDGWTLLHVVCETGNIQGLRLLLALPGIDMNPKDSSGKTPFYRACSRQKFPLIRELLKHPEVDINVANDLGYTPLWRSVRENNPVATLLVASGRELAFTPCHGDLEHPNTTPLDLEALLGRSPSLLREYSESREKAEADALRHYGMRGFPLLEEVGISRFTVRELQPSDAKGLGDITMLWLHFPPQPIQSQFETLSSLERVTLESATAHFTQGFFHPSAPLRELSLRDCSHSGLALLLSSLGSLTSLSLVKCGLRELPEEVGTLKNLTSLNLHLNAITQPPKGLGSLTSLVEVCLKGNPVDLPAFLSLLPRATLEGLDCRECALTSIPMEIGLFTRLRTLSLDDNKVAELPFQISLLPRLQYLSIEGMEVGEASAKVITSMIMDSPALRYVMASRCKMSKEAIFGLLKTLNRRVHQTDFDFGMLGLPEVNLVEAWTLPPTQIHHYFLTSSQACSQHLCNLMRYHQLRKLLKGHAPADTPFQPDPFLESLENRELLHQALTGASFCGDLEMVQRLLEEDAPKVASSIGKQANPLHCAALMGWNRIINLLTPSDPEKKGASLSLLQQKDFAGHYPLHLAVSQFSSADLQTLKLLYFKEHHSSYSMQSLHGSAFRMAVKSNKTWAIMWLLSQETRRAATFMSQEQSHPEVVDWYLAFGRPFPMESLKDMYYISKGLSEKLEVFFQDPKGNRLELRRTLLGRQVPDLLALISFCEFGLLRPRRGASGGEGEPEVRYFDMATRLPLELQMRLCHVTYGIDGSHVTSEDADVAFKALAARECRDAPQ